RALLAARDRHCRFPGCRVDPSRCRAHHVRHWSKGGATCLSNLILLCQRHHALVHEGRWRITADDTHDPGHPDRWRFQPPASGHVGKDGALLAERLRRGHPPEPPPHHAAA
ncbi:MAG: HNH endonuclease signature motif containing protein, partial [Candidatus Nanopelagicales bacterium]